MKKIPQGLSRLGQRACSQAALLVLGVGALGSLGAAAQASGVPGSVGRVLAMGATAAPAPVSSKLSAWKVEQKDGQEAMVAAGKVAPGDVIEYRVEYRNAGSKDVRDLVATLPIPSTMTYVERSNKPIRAQASTNGLNYGAVPLRRRVKKADGSADVVAVPAGQYRFLRWNVPTLAAGQSISFTARARVNR